MLLRLQGQTKEEERKSYSHFPHGERISAATLIKEQTPQRGHKLSSEVFTISTIASIPPVLFIFRRHLIPLYSHLESPVILLPFQVPFFKSLLPSLPLWTSPLWYWTAFFQCLQLFLPPLLAQFITLNQHTFTALVTEDQLNGETTWFNWSIKNGLNLLLLQWCSLLCW